MIYLKKLMRKKKVSFKILITKRNLLNFVKISGDKNKLHLNKNFAKEAGFEDVVVHGAYIINQFSKLIGTKLPGHGSLILFSEYKFHNPAYINKKIIIEGNIVSSSKATSTFNISLTAKYENSKKIITTGNVVVKN